MSLLRRIRAVLDKGSPEQDPRDVVIEQQDREIARLRDQLARHKDAHRENGRVQRENDGLQGQNERLRRERVPEAAVGDRASGGMPASRILRQEAAAGSRLRGFVRRLAWIWLQTLGGGGLTRVCRFKWTPKALVGSIVHPHAD